MKDYAYILILLSVFISPFGKVDASINSFNFASEQDTVKRVTIYFEKNRILLDRSFANNERALSTLDSLLRQSPEKVGSFEWEVKSYTCTQGDVVENSEIAFSRNKSVEVFLRSRYLNLDTLKVNLLAEGEDWTEFRKLVAADKNLPDREEVIMLIDYHANNISKRKELIKKLDKGIPYRYIDEKVLPKLRRAEITVSWKNPKEPDTMLIRDVAVTSDSSQVDNLGQVKVRESKEPVPNINSTKEKKESSKTVLAIKNNLLYDLALAPNIEIEIPVGKKWSFNAEYKCPWWMNNRHNFCYQLLSGGVEARYWLGNRQHRNRLTGHFFGLYAEGGIYDFQFWNDKGYHGNYYGASGLTYGYARQLSRHLSLEFSFGVGYLTTEYKKYEPYEGDIVWDKSGRYNFIGPTKLKVSLVWLLTKRR